MRRRHRVLVGIFIALCGVAIAVGAELTWVGARGARPATGIDHTSVPGLLHWSYQYSKSFLRSFGFAEVIAGVLVVIGGLFGSRTLAGLISLIALAGAGLWFALYVSHFSSVNLPISDVKLGAVLTVAGSVLALISTSYLRRKEF